jgi:hypothetical protein
MKKMAHCQWCGGDIVKSAGSVEHCEFVSEPERFHREEDGATIGCDEEALYRIRRGQVPWGMEEEDMSGTGTAKFPRFKVQFRYGYTRGGLLTWKKQEEFIVSDEDLEERSKECRNAYELEAEIDAARKAVDSLPPSSEAWKKASKFLKEVQEQDQLEQQEEACNRWL